MVQGKGEKGDIKTKRIGCLRGYSGFLLISSPFIFLFPFIDICLPLFHFARMFIMA